MSYDIIKALHVIFIVTWFAGLFYIVRLFVYQVEARTKPDPEKEILGKQYKLMAKRLWFGITWPSFILTLILGPWMLIERPQLLDLDFMQIKLGFVGALVVYHLACHYFFMKLQKDLGEFTSTFFRIWNEIATLFLVAIVFLIVVKNELDWIYGTVGFVLFGIMLMIAIRIYKKLRRD